MIAGWLSAFFLISFIILGATISLKGIAQFYSLSYIVFVLLLQVFYIYIKTLNFNKARVYAFWFPKIILSLLLWLSLYFKLNNLRNILIIVFTAYTLLASWPELKKIAGKIKQQIQNSRIFNYTGGLKLK